MTVAEIVVVADGAVDARSVGEMVDEVVDARGAVVDGVTDAAADAGDAMSDEVSDERDTQREPVLGEHSFHPATLAADRYSAGMSVSKQTAYLSADCFGRKYCRRLQRKC